MNTPVIQVKGLTKRYGTADAIQDVTFSIDEGEVVGFVGLNGAGKSTTINVLLGFLGASAGTVEIFGKVIRPNNAHQSHRLIGYASGDMDLPENLTGKQYLTFVAHQFTGSFDERLAALTERFKPQLNKKIGQLSRGNRQKIALIAAFLPAPRLVILDEPSSGLDPLMQQEFLHLVREEAAAGTTIFMSSHYLQEVAESCSRILLIRGGTITRDMAASELNQIGGKRVSIKAAFEVKPPSDVRLVERSNTRLSFVYQGSASDLQTWISGIKNLEDISIDDHDPEAAFEELYEQETTDA